MEFGKNYYKKCILKKSSWIAENSQQPAQLRCKKREIGKIYTVIHTQPMAVISVAICMERKIISGTKYLMEEYSCSPWKYPCSNFG